MELPIDIFPGELLKYASAEDAASLCMVNREVRDYCDEYYWPEKIYNLSSRHYQPLLPYTAMKQYFLMETLIEARIEITPTTLKPYIRWFSFTFPFSPLPPGEYSISYRYWGDERNKPERYVLAELRDSSIIKANIDNIKNFMYVIGLPLENLGEKMLEYFQPLISWILYDKV